MSTPHHRVLLVSPAGPMWTRWQAVVEQAGYAVTWSDSTLEAMSLLDELGAALALIDADMLGADDFVSSSQMGHAAPIVIAVARDINAPSVDALIGRGLWDCLSADTPASLVALRLERAVLERCAVDNRRVADGTGPVEFTLLGLPSATRYCRFCYHTVQDRDPKCPSCERERPGSGWPRILESRFPWLGYPLSGRFVLEQVIGRGGAGVVYRAVDNQLRRQLAVKVVTIAEDLDPRRREQMIYQLKHEALATAQVRSPHVVQIWDVIGLDETTAALLMDFIEGVTLARYVRDEGKLGIAESLRITRQVALALAAAHEKRLVHRDIKPQNVMIEFLPDGAPFARVLDFGIVHAIDQLSDAKSMSNVGTPMFAAPEQIQNNPIDERTDIYALGGVLHLMLTGAPPYRGKDARALCRAHLRDPLPEIPVDLCRDPHLHQLLQVLIQRTLSKDPAARFANVHQLIEVLDEAATATIDLFGSAVTGTTDLSPSLPDAPKRKTMERILEQYLGEATTGNGK